MVESGKASNLYRRVFGGPVGPEGGIEGFAIPRRHQDVVASIMKGEEDGGMSLFERRAIWICKLTG